MNAKLLLSRKYIKLYAILGIALLNIFIIIMLFSFFKNNVYDTLNISDTELEKMIPSSKNNLDIKKFDNIIDNINKNKKKKGTIDIKNIF